MPTIDPDRIIRARRRLALGLIRLAEWVDSPSWTRAEWEAWHNPPCPEPQDYRVDAVYSCHRFDGTPAPWLGNGGDAQR
jgi:hypothetical protein